MYLSLAYAPYYAMAAKSRKRQKALIQVEVASKYLYPEDDFLMFELGYNKVRAYTQKEVDAVDLNDYKYLYKKSLQYMGNASAKPEHVKVLGVRTFDAHQYLCDMPSPDNYLTLGKYYRNLTKWIYEGNDPLKYGEFYAYPQGVLYSKLPKKIQEFYKQGYAKMGLTINCSKGISE